MASTRSKRESKSDHKVETKAPAKKRKVEKSTKDVSEAHDETEKAPASKGQSDSDTILTYLLDPKTLDSISPEEIISEEAGRDMRYPHSILPPFCALLSALLLSKPFSHRLGMRAIHTILNEPYSFRTPKAVSEAGGDDRWQALMDAHTLHKEKTSVQFRDLAKLIKDEYEGDYDNSDLKHFREAAGGDVKKLQAQVIRFNGFAEKTTSLFFRRVQVQWDELFPYADDLALDAAREVGLEVKTAEDLLKLVKEHVKVDGQELREKFVYVLDVLIGKKLDKDIEKVKDEVGDAKSDAS